MIKVVFMGTPDFAVPTLDALIDHYEVLGVVTQPDRPAGRSQQMKASPVKTLAEKNNIPIFQPEKIRRPEAVEQLKQWKPDVYVVAAFGQILPQEVLDIPSHGSVNVHASLLPRWRGAAPIHAAIRSGDRETGITIMKMDAGLDTGPMLSQAKIDIEADDTGQTLHDKLAQLGADLLVNTLSGYVSGAIKPNPQADFEATYAPQIKKEEGQLNWTHDADSIALLIRAFDPWPGTYTYWQGKQLKIHSGQSGNGRAEPGKVVETDGRIAIGTVDGLFYPTTVQLEGKKIISIDDFVNGYPNFIGTYLGR